MAKDTIYANPAKSGKKLVIVLILILIFFNVVLLMDSIFERFLQYTKPKSSFSGTAPVAEIITESSSARILYTQGATNISSAAWDGSDNLDLSPLLGLNEYSSLDTITSFQDNKRIYFVKDQHVWITNTEGTAVKQITNKEGLSKDISLLLTSKAGDLLFVTQEKFQEKSRFYYYNINDDKLTLLQDNNNSFTNNKAFVELDDTNLRYFNYDDGYLYTIDLSSGETRRLSDVSTPSRLTTIDKPVTGYIFLNSERDLLIYEGSTDEAENDRNQPVSLFAFDYKTGALRSLSPREDRNGRYQLLSLSPNKETIIYAKLIPEAKEESFEYYAYNLESSQTIPLNLTDKASLIETVNWLDDNNFVYNDKETTIYNYNLAEKRRTTLPLEGIIINSL